MVADLHPHQKMCLSKLKRIEKGASMPLSSLATKDISYLILLIKSLIDIGYTEYSFTEDYKEVKRDNGCEYGITELINIGWQK